MQPTPELLAALDYMKNTPEMRVFRVWLKEYANNRTIRAIKAGEDVDVMRGYAHALLDMVELIENASEMRARLENRNGEAKKPNGSRYPGRGH